MFTRKLMVSVALPYKDFPNYEDFEGEDKEWGIFQSYEKFSWIEIERTRNTFLYTERVNRNFTDGCPNN